MYGRFLKLLCKFRPSLLGLFQLSHDNHLSHLQELTETEQTPLSFDFRL
eukprot:UN13722